MQIRDLQEQLEQAQVSVKERTEILKTIRNDNNSKPKLQQAISNIIGKPEDEKKNRRPRNKKEELALVTEDTVDGDYTMEKRFHEGILREVKSYREDILARDYRHALQQMDAFEKAQSEMTEDAFDTARARQRGKLFQVRPHNTVADGGAGASEVSRPRHEEG